MTILLSENDDGGHWIWTCRVAPAPLASDHQDPTCIRSLSPSPAEGVEPFVAFCVPSEFSPIAEGEIPIYYPPTRYDVDSPLFINEGRNSLHSMHRTSRPSSGHPGVVIAAFCDRGVRSLKDDMDKTLFVRLCRPGSGVILNPKDIF